MENHEQRPVRRNRLGFKIHLAAYVLVNGLLAYINLSTSPETLWFQWPLAGWGLGVLLHAAILRHRANGGRRLFLREAREHRVEGRREAREARRAHRAGI